MIESSADVLIVGAGIFGLSTAFSLRKRGHTVSVLDPGPIPHPLASSTDISKVIRMEYGADAFYLQMAVEARDGWLSWNDAFVADGGEALYHESGLAVLSSPPMAQGEFELDSYRTLCEHGFHPERLDAAAISSRFPVWGEGAFSEGFFHEKAGFAQSGRVVRALASLARNAGVQIYEGESMAKLCEADGRVIGVETTSGKRLTATHTIVCAGVWTPALLPELDGLLRVVGQPIFHLQVPSDQRELFSPPSFCTFTADISRTGWYGFPLHPEEGVLKIANHGKGRRIDPIHDERAVTEEEHVMMRSFLRGMLPSLVDAPVVYTRLCLYCDTFDGHFLIDRHPEKPGLLVATGGSGHGFKFGPVIGDIVADVLEEKENPFATRFAWRAFVEGMSYTHEEEARHIS